MENIDFAGKEAAIVEALRRSRAIRDDGRNFGGVQRIADGIYSSPSTGDLFRNILDTGFAKQDERKALGEREALNKEQLHRFDDLNKQLATPGVKAGKVLTRALPGDIGPEQPVETEVQTPMTPEEENARTTGVLGEMYKLPMARKLAETGLADNMKFPERIAETRAKMAEARLLAAQQAGDKAEAAQAQREWQAAQNEMYKRTADQQNAHLAAALAGMNSRAGDHANSIVDNGDGTSSIVDTRTGQIINTVKAGKVAAATGKAEKAATAMEEGQARVGRLLDEMDINVDVLNKNKGITSTKRGGLSNAMSWAQNTGVGQTAGKVFGTTNQSARNNIESLATNLVLELKNVKGLGASQMNSNMELQRYLTAVAGGNNYDAESLKSVVRRARDMLGTAPAPTGGGTAPQAAIDKLKANPALSEQFKAKYGYLP